MKGIVIPRIIFDRRGDATMKKSIVSLLFFVILLFALSAEQRTALVIGNSDYKTSPLKNPANDARDMAAALEELGFSVTSLIDANQRKMDSAVRAFGNDLAKGGVGLFYYAGHGMQVDGVNYLIPVGTDIQSEDEVRFKSVEANQILQKMETAVNRTNIVILDACRDNPFARSFRSGSRGLSVVDAPSGSLVIYATAPESTAADGKGRNGIFTGAFLKHMRTPGQDIEVMLRDVRRDVERETASKQTPWSSSSLTEPFYFVSAADMLARTTAQKKELETELAALEREIKARESRIAQAKSDAERKRLEVEQQTARAVKEAKRIEQENLAREAMRQRQEAERQREEVEMRAAQRTEEERRRHEMEQLAAKKRAETERLKLAGDDPDLLIENVEILEKAIKEIETTFAQGWSKTKAEINKTYGVKLEEVNAMKADPWENDKEFKDRREKIRNEVTSAKALELRQGESDHERNKKTQLRELEQKLKEAIRTLESKSWTLTGSDITVTPGEFDRDRKMWPFYVKSNVQEVPFATLLVKNLAAASDLRSAYMEIDNAIKAKALAGTIAWSIKRKGSYGYQVVVSRVQVIDLSQNNKQLAYGYENAVAASFSPGKRNTPSSTGTTVRFTGNGTEITYRGVVIGKTPFSTDIFREGKVEVECYYSKYNVKQKKTISVTRWANNIDVSPPSIGDSFGGGILFYLDGRGGGLVAAPSDQGKKNWADAKKVCQNLVLNGHDDWYLPSKDELDQMYKNLKKKGLGGFASEWYWSSSEYDSDSAWCQNFDNGRQSNIYRGDDLRVRAVRAF